MKTTSSFFILFLSLVLVSCENDPEQVSKWRLIEQLIDPGDGSGTFQPVNSQKTVSFYDDGTYQSNGITCYVSTESDQPSEGTWSEAEKWILPETCNFSPVQYNYEIVDGHLIISYLCIEPCREKFVQVSLFNKLCQLSSK